MNLLFNLDKFVYENIFLIQRDWATPVMSFITDLLSPVTLPIFALLLMVWFIYKKQIGNAVLVILSLGGGFILETVLKLLIARPRPPVGLIVETDPGFPSGHATLAIIFFVLLIYLFKDYFKSVLARRLFIFINLLLVVLVGFSRLYLGVHWLSDILGGYVVGILWFMFAAYLVKVKSAK